MNRFAFLIFLVTFSLIFNIDDSYAQWKSSCSAINTPVCDTTNSQQDNQIISDGQDGCIIAWRDGRDFSQNPIFRIFLQKLNNDGVSLWEKNGVGVSGTDILYTKFKIISDSHGGAIVIYVVQPFGFNIYAQRIDSLGNSIWNSTGVPIFNDYTPPDFDAVSDGKGGAIIVSPLGWDTITSQPKLVAQRIDPSGNLLWPQKNTIGGTLDRDHDNDLYKIISTEDGGSIITWQQNDIPGGQADFNLYAQKLDSNGISKWGIDGVVVCNSYSTQADAAMCTDLNNGCFITWLDYRSGANSYLQHLDKNGNPNLVANGIIIDTILDYPILISNIDSGAYLMHFGGINDVHNRSLTRIDKSGNILWYKLVPSIYGNNFYIENNQLLSDKQGGVFLTWDENNYGYDVVAQHIDKFGNFLWGPKGIPVSNPYVTSQINAHLVNDDLGGIIMCWDDSRGIFAMMSSINNIKTTM